MNDMHDNVIAIDSAKRERPTFVGLARALHILQGRRRGQANQFADEWVVVARSTLALVKALAFGAYASVGADLRDEAGSLTLDELYANEYSPFKERTDAQARRWLKTFVRSRLVDVLRSEKKTVSYDPEKHGEPVAPLSTVPGYDIEDDPDRHAGRLQDARRAVAHLDLVTAEIARGRRDAAEATVRGLWLWLGSNGAQSLDEQVVEVFGANAAEAKASEKLRMRNVVYKQRSRGRIEGVAAVMRLAAQSKIDDLVEASLYRLLKSSLAEREKIRSEPEWLAAKAGSEGVRSIALDSHFVTLRAPLHRSRRQFQRSKQPCASTRGGLHVARARQ
jgi:hypothetical protein